jgi:hypothetical protein
MVWKENGNVPAVVIEVTSKKTKRDDTEKKRPLYEKTLCIPEYFLFDPTGDYFDPHLQGFRIVEDSYVPITPEERLSDVEAEPSLIPDIRLSTFRLHSEQLGLDLTIEGEMLRFYNALTGEPLLSASELAQRLEVETEARVSTASPHVFPCGTQSLIAGSSSSTV